jgi:hypothetical protein
VSCGKTGSRGRVKGGVTGQEGRIGKDGKTDEKIDLSVKSRLDLLRVAFDSCCG